MAKSKTKRAAGAQPRRRTAGGSLASQIDQQGKAYAALLRDPCNGALCHPTYAGTDNGILTRFETDNILLNGATDAAGIIQWTPGGMGTTGTQGNHLLVGSSATTGGAITPVVLSNAVSPGTVFLTGNAASVRCVSACMQLYWPGSESNRAGLVYTGVCNGATVVAGQAVSTDAVSQVTQFVDRVPTNFVEVKWRPADGDQLMIPPSTNTVLSELVRRNAIVVAVKGIPVSTGLRVRLVAVYEWTPLAGDGIVNPVMSRSLSSNTLSQIVSFLDRSYPGWWHGLGNAALSYVAAVAYGSRRRPAIQL